MRGISHFDAKDGAVDIEMRRPRKLARMALPACNISAIAFVAGLNAARPASVSSTPRPKRRKSG
jgi:hypothetical protein